MSELTPQPSEKTSLPASTEKRILDPFDLYVPPEVAEGVYLVYDPNRGGFRVRIGPTVGPESQLHGHKMFCETTEVLTHDGRVRGVESFWTYGGLPVLNLFTKGAGGPSPWGRQAITNNQAQIGVVRFLTSDAWVTLDFTHPSQPVSVYSVDDEKTGVRLWLTRKEVETGRLVHGTLHPESHDRYHPVPLVAKIEIPRSKVTLTAESPFLTVVTDDLRR